MKKHQGFTLVELICVIVILAVLAATAVPKFLDLGQQARIAAVTQLRGTLRSVAENTRVMCLTNPACDYTAPYQTPFTIAGKVASINYGWLDAGDADQPGQIKAWVDTAGFTVTDPAISHTLFTLDGAPDPANCSVTYWDAFFRGPVLGIDIVLQTSGC